MTATVRPVSVSAPRLQARTHAGCPATETAGQPVELIRQCAWCRKTLTAEGWVNQGEPAGNVTHGLCPGCLTTALEELRACGS